jgi:hypothetical protein
VAEYSAVGEVGQTLVTMLRNRLREHWGAQLDNDDAIVLAPPTYAPKNKEPWITLFLYRVTENSHLKNAKPQQSNGTITQPPLALDLYFLLTAYAVKDVTLTRTEETVKQHAVFGEAMQVMQDNAILRGSDLAGSLSEDDKIQITLHSMTTEEVLNIWNTFEERPYELSVSYVVGPVFLESTREGDLHRVKERRVDEYTWQSRTNENA